MEGAKKQGLKLGTDWSEEGKRGARSQGMRREEDEPVEGNEKGGEKTRPSSAAHWGKKQRVPNLWAE